MTGASPRLDAWSALAAALLTLVAGAVLLGLVWTPFDPGAVDPSARLQPPSAVHWFGTDQYGRDVFSRILSGGALSVSLALAATTMALLIGALVGGFEYTFYSVFRSAADVGVLAEYSYDGRDTDVPLQTLLALRPPPAGVPPTQLPEGTFSLGDTPPTIFDNDIFAGIRISPNDEQSTEFLAGGVVDVDTRTAFVLVEASRRIGERWKVELDARIFANVAKTDLFYDLRNDSFLQLRIARYF